MSEEIWEMISELAIELHPDRVEVVADSISKLESVDGFEKVQTRFGQGSKRKVIRNLGEAWRRAPHLLPVELSAALRAASSTSEILQERESVEMVWTGPTTGLVPSRHTEQVLLQVINEAKRRVFIVSFVAHGVGSIVQELQKATQRGVKVEILLESSKSHGGKIDTDSIETFKKKLPTADIYCWNSASKASEKWTGAVHAKCLISDGQLAFITSANLTQAALERNMELGILIRGGCVPEGLDRHLESLVVTGIIKKI